MSQSQGWLGARSVWHGRLAIVHDCSLIASFRLVPWSRRVVRSIQQPETDAALLCVQGGSSRGRKYQRGIQAREVHKNAVMLAHVDCSYIGVIDKLA